MKPLVFYFVIAFFYQVFKYKGIIEYCGTNYHGMQKQNGLKTIQSQLEKAISIFADEEIKIDYCGRTDAGVHAIGQVIQFELKKEMNIKNIKNGINFYLNKEEIKVIFIENMPLDFHVRFDAKERIYLYKIINRTSPLTFQKNYFTHIKEKLNIEKMVIASKIFLGRHDFNAFRSSECQAKNSIRTINNIIFQISNEEIHIYFYAKSFLHNMVRILIGSLIEVGKEKVKITEIKKILLEGKRSVKCPTAKVDGLYFFSAVY